MKWVSTNFTCFYVCLYHLQRIEKQGSLNNAAMFSRAGALFACKLINTFIVSYVEKTVHSIACKRYIRPKRRKRVINTLIKYNDCNVITTDALILNQIVNSNNLYKSFSTFHNYYERMLVEIFNCTFYRGCIILSIFKNTCLLHFNFFSKGWCN